MSKVVICAYLYFLTFCFDHGVDQGYIYSRDLNPNRAALEAALAKLEGGKYCKSSSPIDTFHISCQDNMTILNLSKCFTPNFQATRLVPVLPLHLHQDSCYVLEIMSYALLMHTQVAYRLVQQDVYYCIFQRSSFILVYDIDVIIMLKTYHKLN